MSYPHGRLVLLDRERGKTMRIRTTDIKVGDVITTTMNKTFEVTRISRVIGRGRFFIEGKVPGDSATHIHWMNTAGSVRV